jgi:hypothetical protein
MSICKDFYVCSLIVVEVQQVRLKKVNSPEYLARYGMRNKASRNSQSFRGIVLRKHH